MKPIELAKIERAFCVIVGVFLIVFSIIAWVAIQAGPPPYILVLLILLPFALAAATVDSLVHLRSLTRSIIGILTSLLALVFLIFATLMGFGVARGDLIIPLIYALFFGYYNLRINQWWQKRS